MEEKIMARKRAGKNKAGNSIDASINTASIFRNRMWKNEFGKERRTDRISNGNCRWRNLSALQRC